MKTLDLSMFNTAEARLRLLSGLILAPVVLGLVMLGGYPYAAVTALATAVGLYEWLRLVDAEAPMPDRAGLYAALLLTIFLATVELYSLSLLALCISTAALYAHRSNYDAKRAFWFSMGLPYMACTGVALIHLRFVPGVGFSLIAYLLAVVWGVDIGAYVAGRYFGGAKLAPSISPGKTWAGLAGGVGLAVFLALLALLLTKGSILLGLWIAVGLALVAQGGDLFKSYFKRLANVKDSGGLIPGHGGILDRIDGLSFAAILLALLQAFFGSRLIW